MISYKFGKKLGGLVYRMELQEEIGRLRVAGRRIDRSLAKQVFQNPYRLDDFLDFLIFFQNTKSLNLIDIGANEGVFTQDFLNFFPKAEAILCVEPILALAKSIKRKYAEDNRIVVMPNAFGNLEEKKILRIPAKSTALASFHHYNENANKFYLSEAFEEISVSVVRMDEACEQFSLDNDFVVKIDTQGHEIEVIKGGLRTLERAMGIILECSFSTEYQDLEPSFLESARLLESIGFAPIVFQNHGKMVSRHAFERDVIFVKKDKLDCIYFKNY